MRKILCKLLVLCALWCLLPTSAQAVVITNAGFTTSLLGPCTGATNVTVRTNAVGNRIQDVCAAWFTPTNGHPDYFHGCDVVPATPDYGVPINDYFPAGCNDASDPAGTYTANQRAYAGIEIREDAGTGVYDREYITQQLATPLYPGRTYVITFMLRSSTLPGKQLLQRIGCLLTTNAPTAGNTVDLDNGAILTGIGDYGDAYDATGWKSDAWYFVSVNVTVTGAVARNYLTIGVFDDDIDDLEWLTQPGGNAAAPGGGDAYYVIDNVSVCSVCPTGVNAIKKSTSTPTQCCYDVTLVGETGVEFCSSVARLDVVTSEGTTTINGPITLDTPFEVCVDRFESGPVFFRLFDASGNLLCQFSQELKCDCTCDETVNPPDFNVKLVPSSAGPATCCWNIVVDNATGTFLAGKGCDLKTLGISFSVPPGLVTPAIGYSEVLAGGVNYITKNNTADGDTYMHGTSTIIGTFCVPQGTLDMPVAFHILDQIGMDGVPTICGLGMFTTATCASKCCPTGNITAVPFTTPDAPPFTCCFTITAPTLLPPNSLCVTISKIVLQSYDISTGWVTLQTVLGPPSPSHIFSTKACTPIGVAKKVRVVYYDNTNTPVCVKETTIKCEVDCCSRVVNMQAYREPQFPCCYRVHGYTNGPGAGCPSIISIVVQEYIGSSWVTTTMGAPDMSGYFDIRVCATPPTANIRVQFMGINGVVCTRWLTFNCPLSKMGSESPAERVTTIDSKAWAVPNPASDETTIHYTLLEKADVRITLFNSIGEVVTEITPKHLSVGEQQTTIPTAQLPSGMYYAQISTGNDIITLPITIVR